MSEREGACVERAVRERGLHGRTLLSKRTLHSEPPLSLSLKSEPPSGIISLWWGLFLLPPLLHFWTVLSQPYTLAYTVIT